jgi:hypothetical protein
MGSHTPIDSVSAQRSMPDAVEDIRALNERVFLTVRDSRDGATPLRSLGAAPQLIEPICSAGPGAVAAAVRCNIPLIVFTPALESRLHPASRVGRWPAMDNQSSPHQILTLTSLQVARDLAIRNITMAKTYFGVSRMSAERLASLALSSLEPLSCASESLLQLRCAQDLHWWKRVLIGDRVSGERALRLVQMAAQQALRDQ